MKNIANTPKPPYYSVIFTSITTGQDQASYQKMADKMYELAVQQPGFLGFESAVGISISYWSDLASIKNWKNNLQHISAQNLGREKWYSAYKTRIARVERDYDFGL